jgi:crotonobetaine/carnitine-CoA ligase
MDWERGHRIRLAELLERQALATPDKTFLRIDADEVTYEEALRRARATANRLIELGLEPGETIAYFAGASHTWFDLMFGAPLAGVISTPVNTAFRGEFLAHQLVDSDAAALVADASLLPLVEQISNSLPRLRLLLVRGELDEHASLAIANLDHMTVVDVESLLKGPSDADHNDRTPLGWDEPAYVFYTSGTTGPSKGALLTQGYVLAYGSNHCSMFGHTSDDRFYGAVPTFHLSGMMLMLAAVITGGTSTLDTVFSATRCWERVREVDATVFIGVGAMVIALANQPPEFEHDLPLRLFHAAPIPTEMHHALEARWGVRILVGYGMTEAMPILVHDGEKPAVPGSIGNSSPRFDVRIVDDDDDDVPIGEIGELLCRPRMRGAMFEGYRGRPEATLDQLRGLWFHTGDFVRADANGNYFFVDRKKDAIRRRGENISSFEIERAVLAHPAVVAAAAHAVPSKMLEDDVKVVVMLKPGVDLTHEELHAHCVATMPRFAVPRYIEFVGSLPTNAVGRVQKVLLRENPFTEGTWDNEAVAIKP